ncbi:MAG: TIM barrel protein [Thermogutta sp.]|nr:TIM barrel protein [Thermogutta sp.]HPU06385.1 TIM barrel protein [Thermogutta sp.]HPZ82744.1 TIM barrel protein [Thermogutta sp.]HQF14303.1 TIM barrel protein [Thermogutta sp.]
MMSLRMIAYAKPLSSLIVATSLLSSASQHILAAEPEFGVLTTTQEMRQMPPAVLAALLRETGYQSVGAICLAQQLPEWVETFRRKDLRVGNVYIKTIVKPDACEFECPLDDVFKALEGSNAVVMLNIHEAGTPVDNAVIAQHLRPWAEKAAKAGVQLAIYPHVGFRVAKDEDALAIAKTVNHPHFGVCFNLCHFLKQHEMRELRPTLEKGLPYLKMVTINGSAIGDTQNMNWDKLIQPLDEGEFDLSAFLHTLYCELGYRGPCYVQCYGLTVPAKELLERTLTAWKQIMPRCP